MSLPLPLLTRAPEGGVTFAISPARPTDALRPIAARMPPRAPGPGEQYRFHFDMGKCIGCKCCVVACNEQNGNPAAINWRRVGEIEGGWYPHTHALVPVDGLQPLRRADVHERLSGGRLHEGRGDRHRAAQRRHLHRLPVLHVELLVRRAAVQPGARRGRQVRPVPQPPRDWARRRPACPPARRAPFRSKSSTSPTGSGRESPRVPAPGVPVADQSISTTRVTLPKISRRTRVRSICRAQRRRTPHWPLIIMTVLTQLSVGALATIWLLQLLGASTRLGVAALTVGARRRPGAGGVDAASRTSDPRVPRVENVEALLAEPRGAAVHARSAVVACVVRRGALAGAAGSTAVGALTVALGLGGVTASAFIYRVPSRPAWNTPFTLVQFHLTAATLGPLFAAAVGAGDPRLLGVAAATHGRRAAGHARAALLPAERVGRASSCARRARCSRRRWRRASCCAARCWRSGRSRCRSSRPSGGALARRSPRRSPAKCSAAICSSSARCRSTWRRRIWEARPREPQALPRPRHARRERYAYARRSGDGLHGGRQDSRPLGANDLRLLLGRLRDVHRRQGRPRGQRPRQSGSSRQQRRALSEGPLGARDASTRRPARSIRCCVQPARGESVARRAAAARSAGTSRMQTMARRFRDVQAAHGPEAVGVISTGQLVTEEFYTLGKLVQLGLGTPPLRRQHDAVHVHGGRRLQALVRQRRPARRVRGSRTRRRHPADRRQHRRQPSDPLAAARGQPATRR